MSEAMSTEMISPNAGLAASIEIMTDHRLPHAHGVQAGELGAATLVAREH
jgi:hypothetical protein